MDRIIAEQSSVRSGVRNAPQLPSEARLHQGVRQAPTLALYVHSQLSILQQREQLIDRLAIVRLIEQSITAPPTPQPDVLPRFDSGLS